MRDAAGLWQAVSRPVLTRSEVPHRNRLAGAHLLSWTSGCGLPCRFIGSSFRSCFSLSGDALFKIPLPAPSQASWKGLWDHLRERIDAAALRSPGVEQRHARDHPGASRR